jgi:hypothetical protein
VNQKLFSTALLMVCLLVMSGVEALGQQQQRRRSGGLDNLSLPSTGRSLASSSWQKFAPEGAGFSVMMPGLPDETSKEMGPNAASLKEYRLKAGETEYVVGVLLNFPAELLQNPDFVAKYFEMLPHLMMRSPEYAGRNYRLSAQRNITINDHPGRQYRLDSADYACTMRVVLAERSIYIMSVESAKASLSNENVEKFLASFALEEN